MITKELADYAGVSLRQLQWWDEQGWVKPQHDGHCRIYDECQVWKVCVISQLRRKDMKHKQIRKILTLIKPMAGYLVTDGSSFRQCESLHCLAQAVVKFARPIWVIETPLWE